MKSTSALILAAGLSNRMGQEKFALEFSPGVTFLEHIASQFQNFGCGIIVVVLNPAGFKLLKGLEIELSGWVQFAVNENPEHGRFSSIKTGAELLENEELVFIGNIDNPSVNEAVLNELYKSSNSADCICPKFEGRGGHPVLVSNRVIRAIIQENNPEINFKDFLSGFNPIRIPVNDQNILLNINTIEDYRQWRQKKN